MKKIIYLLVLVNFLLVSCKKYEEGPLISLSSKKERASNTWRVERANQNGTDKTNEYHNWRLTLTKEGYYLYYSVGNTSVSLNFTGTWEFTENGKYITAEIRDLSGNSIIKVYRVLKLKENELWIVDTTENIEVRYVPA